ncbi:Crp/Fnr family transcriptional regulator [Flavisolibacter nicotianae]|uniref:Crp/Fnr family transcriptional regulator n=1 Tax=Flavisolibacter nicotianae TaxID=2364882 RepID=UPI000EAF4754|nr:Crp/Fnr family transcriptional regulator [Flavisolibacter nicotianae]
MDELLKYLESIHAMSDGLKEHLAVTLKEKRLLRKDYLLRAGQASRQIYFISRGLLRCFYIKEDQEVSSWFMKEGDVIVSVESFFGQKPSYESIVALEDCLLYYITYDELQYIYRHFPEFNFIGRALLEKYYTLSEQRLYSLRMQRSQERYEYLLKHHPDLVLRVPMKHLASYLGITEETLSRIRSKLN